ncbi:MAG: hypothetical protein UY18_C0014G0012 [Microgenomates group bacterium GW2011_GWF2_47_9]|nr:MAG: hypothetical protein UY18_C0014G0012 [Microgenomates group bacterium GW2011_GWF2_47_9]
MMKLWRNVGILIFLYTIVLILLGSYKPNFFDSALAQLAGKYAGMGLTPYRDFGMVYPPLQFLFWGMFKENASQATIQVVSGLIYLVVSARTYQLLKTGLGRSPDDFQIGALAIIEAVILRQLSLRGILPLSLALLLICEIWASVKVNRQKYTVLWLGMIMMWLRWDTGIVLAALTLFVAFFSVNLRKTALLLALGVVLGGAALYLYLQALGILELGWDYIVRMPIWLTQTYRDLPLPTSFSLRSPDMMIYPTLAIVGLIGAKLLSSSGPLYLRIMLLGFTVLYLPYALGRSDFGHFQPLWLVSALSLFFVEGIWGVSRWGRALLSLTLIMVAPWFLYNSFWLQPKVGEAHSSVEREIGECQKIASGALASSIFVGRKNYDHYLFNIASLYLVRGDLPPATRFIAEEPGIQSSCKYGGEVAQELAEAEHPILMFLELDNHGSENKATAEMKSCGKIEYFLENNESEYLGSCTAWGHPFEVRLYK